MARNKPAVIFFALTATLILAQGASSAPPAPVCGDVNASYSVTSSDALAVLRVAVDQPIALKCSPSATVAVHGGSLEFAGESNSSPNFLFAVPISLPVESYAIHIGVYGKIAGALAKLAIYEDDGGAPGALLAGTGTFTMSVGKREVPINFPTFLPAGTYWVASIFGSASSIGYQNVPGIGKYRAWTFGDALPDPFGSPTVTTDSEQYNLYLKTIQ